MVEATRSFVVCGDDGKQVWITIRTVRIRTACCTVEVEAAGISLEVAQQLVRQHVPGEIRSVRQRVRFYYFEVERYNP